MAANPSIDECTRRPAVRSVEAAVREGDQPSVRCGAGTRRSAALQSTATDGRFTCDGRHGATAARDLLAHTDCMIELPRRGAWDGFLAGGNAKVTKALSLFVF